MSGRLRILDIWVDPVDMQQALQRVAGYVESGGRLHTVFASNPEKNFSIPADPFLYEMFRTADLIIPDGIGMVLAARILHGARLSRVPGCDLMQAICELSSRKGYRIFLYGAREEVNGKAAEELGRRYPGIRIVGRCNGYLPGEEMDGLVSRINDSGAQILFLALGSPMQERWIAEHGGRLEHVRVCQGTGGTFDVIAGAVRRAPEAFCRLGLEWLYRLMGDPSRISRQKLLPVFAWLVLREKLRMLFTSRR